MHSSRCCAGISTKAVFKVRNPFSWMYEVGSLSADESARSIHNYRQFSETRGRCWCQKEGKRGMRDQVKEKKRCLRSGPDLNSLSGNDACKSVCVV